jgi:hypothetical protein
VNGSPLETIHDVDRREPCAHNAAPRTRADAARSHPIRCSGWATAHLVGQASSWSASTGLGMPFVWCAQRYLREQVAPHLLGAPANIVGNIAPCRPRVRVRHVSG